MNILEILKFEYFIAIAIGYVVYQVIRYFVNLVYSNMIQKRHQANAKLTREVRDKKIQAFVIKYGNNSSLTREEICKIINLSLYELSEAIKNKSITSVRATLIYALNCCTVGKELEAIADCDFEKALEEAVNADKIINSTEKSKLPLLIGVPISIKDHIRVKGYLDTLGYCSLYNNKSPKNCYFVDELIKLGAVILCKSNIPQGLLAAESKNLIWGNSKNIWDLTRTSGGSSGGEGSLISSFCSPVGLGTDVAGSIRIPAYYSGIYGFKTTSNKTSLNGYICTNGELQSGWNGWNVSSFFLCRKFEDLVYLSKLFFGRFKDDYLVDQSPFNEELFNTCKKIKIAVGYNYKNYEVQPCIKSGIDNLVEKLKEQTNKNLMNYEFVEFDWNLCDDLFYSGYNSMLNGRIINEFFEILKGEKEMDFYKDYKPLIEASDIKLSLIRFILSFTNEKRNLNLLNKIKIERIPHDIWLGMKNMIKLRQKFYDFCKLNEIDAFIMPLLPTMAPKLGNAIIGNSTTFYSMIVNILDLPAISIPIGSVENDEYKTQYTDMLSNILKNDVKGSKGIPLSVQIASSFPGKDELCLKIAKDCVSITNLNYNNLEINNNQTQNFWKLRNLNQA